MAMLRKESFCVVPLRTVVSLVRSGRRPRPKTVAITFDDGYSSTCTRALPVLLSCAIPSTVFLATSFIGTRASFGWLPAEDDPESLPMSWDQAAYIHDRGMEIGSHTARHLFLPLLSDHEIRRELKQSSEAVAGRTGCVTRALALPYSYPLVHRRWRSLGRVLTEAMEESGYTSCSTLMRGRPVVTGHAVFLSRVAVTGRDSLATFRAKALGLYGYSSVLHTFYQKYFKDYGV
jgi:peptidoglycan/xylan/chitin deacetylase (PgdA/CDA1 family)